MSYIRNLYSGRIGALHFLVGDLLVLGFFVGLTKLGEITFFNNFLELIEIVLLLGGFVFLFSVFVRRLHDINRTGWWTLLALVPVANAILGLILLLKSGTEGENKYGLPPREAKHLMQDLFAVK